MRRTPPLRTVGGIGLVIALTAATIVGCSSSDDTATPVPSTTTRKVSTITAEPVTTPAPSAGAKPRQAAIAFGQRMLAAAVLPAGAQPSTAKAPSALSGPCELLPGKVVLAHRLWTMSGDAQTVYEWLQAHVPSGFQSNGTCSSSRDTGVMLKWGIIESPSSRIPNNVSDAELQFGIAKNAAGGTTVRADAVVGWTEPRPANEYVSSQDRTVIVTVLHSGEPGSPRGRSVAASDAQLVGPVVRTFNRLAVDPGGASNCPSSDSRTVSYEVAFAVSSTATPDVIATIGNCGGLSVTVRGHHAPSLRDNPEFGHAVARVLGSELTFG